MMLNLCEKNKHIITYNVSPFIARKLKSEVLQQLPMKRRQVVSEKRICYITSTCFKVLYYSSL